MVRKSRRSLTLIEVMIVLFLIGMVISVLTYSMKGSMDEGKCFKARQRALQIEQLLMMVAAQTNESLEAVASDPAAYLERTGMVKKGTEFMTDPWGKPMLVSVEDNQIIVKSSEYETLMRKRHGETWVEKRN
jgi:general secretion pathway protein G